MPQTRANKSQTPINSDAFNLIPDLASFSDSLEVVVPVTNDAEGDTIAATRATAGWPVSDARPLFTYNTTTKTIRIKDSGGWRDLAAAIRHAEYTAPNQTQTAATGKTFGTTVADSGQTFANTFSSAAAGGVSITENGVYAFWFSAIGGSNMGSSVQLWAITGGETVFSATGNSYGGNTITGAFTDYIQATTTISFGVTGSNTFDFTGRIKVTKLQG